MCNLIWCYIDKLVCFAWIVAKLHDKRPSFLAVVRHVRVFSISVCDVFRCSTVSVCASSYPAVTVYAAKGSCSYKCM